MVKGAVLFSLVGKLTACNAGQRWVNDKAFYSDIDNCEACAGVCCNEGWHHFSLHAADKHCWCYGDDARWGHDDSFVGGDCYAEDSKLIATADASDTLSGAPLPTPYREPLAGAPLPTPYRDPSVGKSATCQYGPLVTHVGEMWVKPGENHTVTHTYYPDDRLHGSSWIKMPAEIFRGPSSKSDMMSFVKTQTTDEDFVMITDAAKFDRTTLEVLESWEVSANDIVTTCHSFNQCTPEGVLQPPSREMVRAAREGVEPVCTFCHGSHTHSATHLNKFFFAHARAADGSLLSVMFIRHGNGDTWVTHVNEVMIVKKHVLHPSTRGATNPFCDVYGKEGVELGPDENNALIAMQPLTQDDVLLV
jgi:hypothetical protein